jgi:low temperature requirement protein LtrA
VSLYSPQERDEHARTGQRPGLEDWPLAETVQPAGRVRFRLGYLTVVLVVIGLLQLVSVGNELASASADPATVPIGMLAAAIGLVAGALSLGLAGQLWYLRQRDKPAPVVVATSIATAAIRGLLAIALGFGAGRSAAVAIFLPLIACGYAIWLITARAREIRTVTA